MEKIPPINEGIGFEAEADDSAEQENFCPSCGANAGWAQLQMQGCPLCGSHIKYRGAGKKSTGKNPK